MRPEDAADTEMMLPPDFRGAKIPDIQSHLNEEGAKKNLGCVQQMT